MQDISSIFAVFAVLGLALAVALGVPAVFAIPYAAALGWGWGYRQGRAEEALTVRAISERTTMLESELRTIRDEEEGSR